MTATPLTVKTTIPVSVVIAGTDLVYTDLDLTTPVTAWPVAISTPTTWYLLDVNDAARVGVTITAAHNVVLFDQWIYPGAHGAPTFDADALLTPAMVAKILGAPHTWAGS